MASQNSVLKEGCTWNFRPREGVMETASGRLRILTQTRLSLISPKNKNAVHLQSVTCHLCAPPRTQVLRGMRYALMFFHLRGVTSRDTLPHTTPHLHASLFEIRTTQESSAAFIRVGPRVTWSWCTWSRPWCPRIQHAWPALQAAADAQLSGPPGTSVWFGPSTGLAGRPRQPATQTDHSRTSS